MTDRTTTTALVTGGGGFIGTWVLRELLRRDIQPVVFDVSANRARWRLVLGADANRVSFVESSLLDTDRLARACLEFEVSHLIHLAALLTPACQQDPWTGCQVNVTGSLALFELARAQASRIRGFSYASSYAVFGPEADEQASGFSSQENHPPTFYGVFKKAVEMIAEQYWRHFGVASVGIRPHVVYGPERDQGLTAGPSQAVRAAAIGEPSTIGFTGSVGYDYVEDVALAFVRAALETPPGANVVDLPGERASTEEFVAAIDAVLPGAGSRVSVSGPPIDPNIPPNPNPIARLFPDWRATSLAAGVRRTVDFYRSIKNPSDAEVAP